MADCGQPVVIRSVCFCFLARLFCYELGVGFQRRGEATVSLWLMAYRATRGDGFWFLDISGRRGAFSALRPHGSPTQVHKRRESNTSRIRVGVYGPMPSMS